MSQSVMRSAISCSAYHTHRSERIRHCCYCSQTGSRLAPASTGIQIPTSAAARLQGGVLGHRFILDRIKGQRSVSTQAFDSLSALEPFLVQLSSSPSAVSVDWGALLTGDRLALSGLSLALTVLYFVKLRDADVASAELVEEKRLSRALSAQVQDFTEGRDAASKELAEVRSESEELRKQVEAARIERQQTADSLSSSQQAVTRLTETLQDVSDARDSLEQQIAALKERERQATEELTATAAVIVELKARAAQGESDSAKFKQQVQSLRQEYRQMTNKLDDKVDRLEKELRAREARLAEQSEIISGLRVEVSETRLNAQVAIDELRDDLMTSQNLLKASQIQAEDLSLDVGQLEKEKAQLLEEREQLFAQLDDADKAGLEAESLLQATCGKIETLEKARNAAVQDAKELLAEVRELNFALDESNEATEHMTTELSAVQAEAENTQGMVSEMKTERDSFEARLLEAQQDIGEGTSRERDIQEQLLKADQANEQLEAQLVNAKETIRKQGEDREQSEGKIMQLEEEKAEAIAEARALAAELESMRSDSASTSAPASAAELESVRSGSASNPAPVPDTSYETARNELSQLRTQLKKAQAAARPNNGGMIQDFGASPGEPGSAPSGSPSEQVTLSPPVSGDELAAEAQISAANKRAVEVRAEAAMLVEAVEDRAYSAIEEAQAEAAKNAAEVQRLKQELATAQGIIDVQ